VEVYDQPQARKSLCTSKSSGTRFADEFCSGYRVGRSSDENPTRNSYRNQGNEMNFITIFTKWVAGGVGFWLENLKERDLLDHLRVPDGKTLQHTS
jgi:hypothetical protein